jgi:pimeloyl-ACP methyl ester carboxylesterase
LKYRCKARGRCSSLLVAARRCSSLLVAARRCSSLLVAALTVSLLSGCNLGLQPRGVEPLPSSTGAESTAGAGANTWLEWPKSSPTEESVALGVITPRRYECYHGGNFCPDSKPPLRNSSGISFQHLSGEEVLVDVADGTDGYGGTDQYTTEINIDIPMKRYVGLTEYFDQAFLSGTLSRNALLEFPIFDIDPPSSSCSEVAEVFLNNHRLGIAIGSPDAWKLNKFIVPIQNINFPATPGDVAHNSFRINVNSRDCQDERWSAAVDWVKLSFKAGPVVVFVHGINSEGDTWIEFKNKVTVKGIVSDNSITLPYDDFDKNAFRDTRMCDDEKYTSTTVNAAKVAGALKGIAQKYGTGDLALVTHSKGGMDSKAAILLFNPFPDIEVGNTGKSIVKETLSIQSLITINTPHLGTPAADLGILKVLEENLLTKPGEFDNILGKPKGSLWGGIQAVAQWAALNKLLSKNYLCDLTTKKATIFNAGNPILVHKFGTNTDAPSSPPYLTLGDITDFGTSFSTLGLDVMQRLYEYVGNTQNLEFHRNFRGLYTVLWNTNAKFSSNDILVTRSSAEGSGIPFVVNQKTGVHHTRVIQRVSDSNNVPDTVIRAALTGTYGVDWRMK